MTGFWTQTTQTLRLHSVKIEGPTSIDKARKKAHPDSRELSSWLSVAFFLRLTDSGVQGLNAYFS
jgi:hypothetical protein